jgi:hypothetical protein
VTTTVYFDMTIGNPLTLTLTLTLTLNPNPHMTIGNP